MAKKTVENFSHDEASRRHIPTAEFESVLHEDEKSPIQVAYNRRNPDLDPQLVWRGKDMQDWSDLVVQAPPLYIQEKVHPKVLIDDLRQMTETQKQAGVPQQIDMFSDFNGLPSEAAKTEFYQHDANWSNRMILGDSLQVMASLAEREGLRGKVQAIYIDPPYGIKFNSNFQWSTTSRTVKDGKVEHITREPEQVKAFRDTWRYGIHSYLTYLRDRLTIARDLLTDTGSIFVQIGDENVHRVRALLDEVFGEENFVLQIFVKKTTGAGSPSKLLAPPEVGDYVLWYSKQGKSNIKFRPLFNEKVFGDEGSSGYRNFELNNGHRISISSWENETGKFFDFEQHSSLGKVYALDNLTSQAGGEEARPPIEFQGEIYKISRGSWKTSKTGIRRLIYSNRIDASSKGNLGYIRYFQDFPAMPLINIWSDTVGQNQFGQMGKVYVVQTAEKIVMRCLLMSTDPGDLVLDPTCGSGTTAYVAEQMGRRWITIDTSRVSLALARARIMGARYPYYYLKDSKDGQQREAELSRSVPSEDNTFEDIRQGFVYYRIPHIMLKGIANNVEIEVIWENYQEQLELLREQLNKAAETGWEEWEIPREADNKWPQEAKDIHAKWLQLRSVRQKEIDTSIAAKSEFEYLCDKPYVDNKKVRVAGPFTVENLSPHRILGVDENDDLIDFVAEGKAGYGEGQSFVEMILENLKTAGVQQAHKEDKIKFSSLVPWPGEYVCAEGRYFEGVDRAGKEKRAAIFIGPEFGTVSRPDLVAAAREAGDGGFDALISCAFNYDARSTEFDKLGAIPVLKARMNADLHMADDLKNTGKGNLFVIFGEPDIDILDAESGQIKVKINGVDVFHPNTGEIRSDGAEGIACWFIDSDYNEESFFVRHAYFLGANDPYSSLKTTLRAEINEEAWESLNSDMSRPFDKPESGRIAVKVINHLGDEVMKVFRVK
jgi:adenine-specific DNA-methyltransferase